MMQIRWKNLFIFTLCFILFIWGLFAVVEQIEPAAASSALLEPGCVKIDTVGSVIISRCYDDETSTVIYANSVGWMDVQE